MNPRLEFTASTKRAARERANTICECARLRHLKIPGINPDGCGQPLGPGNTFYEHINQAYVADDASLENCAVLTKTCWRIKTDYCDQPTVARVRQREDRNSGIARTRRGRPMAGTKASGWRKPFRGPPERRT